ncbi:hypothetical protein ACAG39_00780 [Caldicellulosiruptoraceae bacterium PP1]
MVKRLEQNKRRIKHLQNIIQKWTRTERHLEEFGSIMNDDKIKQAIDKQKRREDQISSLQKALLNEYDREDEVRNLVKNYLYTEGYLSHNKDKLNQKTIDKIKRHQEFRKIHLENLIKKNDEIE